MTNDDLTIWPGGGGLIRDQRRAGRAISRQQVTKQLRELSADLETDISITKTENATMATISGMSAVVRVSKALEHLEQMSPAATGRLNLLADDHALGVADTLQDLRRVLRRI